MRQTNSSRKASLLTLSYSNWTSIFVSFSLVGLSWVALLIGPAVAAAQTQAQTNPASGASTEAALVPRLIQFSGILKDRMGQPLTGVQGVTFALYREQQDGAPLWIETQNVTADEQGRFAALLGATQPEGLPLDLFTSGQAHFLGVQAIQSRDSDGAVLMEQPRILLASVPYALAAATAQPAVNSAAKAASADSPPQAAASPQGDITAVIAGNGLSGGGAEGDVTLRVMPCESGQILKWTGGPTTGQWNCRLESITAVNATAGGGLTASTSANVASLGLLTSCSNGQVLKWNGSAWACAADNNSGGTITGVAVATGSESGLTGGGTLGGVTLGIDPAVVPRAGSAFRSSLNVVIGGPTTSADGATKAAASEAAVSDNPPAEQSGSYSTKHRCARFVQQQCRGRRRRNRGHFRQLRRRFSEYRCQRQEPGNSGHARQSHVHR